MRVPRVSSLVSLSLICFACGVMAPVPSNEAPLRGGSPGPSVASASLPSPAVSGGWHLTVYYTPVESYHGPPIRSITDCSGRDLGRHSSEFLDHVQTEGFGRVGAPLQKMSYLGWNFDRRCWFAATTPVGADDRPLRAWISVAAPTTVSFGASVRVDGCGSDIDATTCTRVRGAAWVVDDRFSADPSDPKHLDLYVGEEDEPNFEDQSPHYFEVHGASVRVVG